MMNYFDLDGEVNIQTLPVSIDAIELGVDGAPARVVDRRPTGVHVQELRIGGRSVPLDALRRIPCEPLNGTPIGCVNYHWNERGEWIHGGPLHVVWLNRDGKIRRTLVGEEPPSGTDPEVWQRRYAELASLPHLFIDL
jgi:hypothetical protein